jgi:hypothetical protein
MSMYKTLAEAYLSWLNDFQARAMNDQGYCDAEWIMASLEEAFYAGVAATSEARQGGRVTEGTSHELYVELSDWIDAHGLRPEK